MFYFVTLSVTPCLIYRSAAKVQFYPSGVQNALLIILACRTTAFLLVVFFFAIGEKKPYEFLYPVYIFFRLGCKSKCVIWIEEIFFLLLKEIIFEHELIKLTF